MCVATVAVRPVPCYANIQATALAILLSGAVKWLPGFISKWVGMPISLTRSWTERVQVSTWLMSGWRVRLSLSPREK